MGFNFWFYGNAVFCGLGLANGLYWQSAFNLFAAVVMLYVKEKDKHDLHDS